MKNLIILKTIFLLFLQIIMAETATSEPPPVQIYLLDVGQGDAMLLHQPGQCAALIDAGPLISGHLVTKKIRELGVAELDFVIITHPHLDHFGGLFDLAPRVGIKHLYDNGETNPKREYFDDYLQLRRHQPYSSLKLGDSLQCGKLEVSVIHPPLVSNEKATINEKSLALMISSGTFKLLHMGDVSGAAENNLVKQDIDLQADMLKVAHHGALDATSEQFLDKVKPAAALISTAKENEIDSPSEIIIQRLDTRGTRIYRTDINKTVLITVLDETYHFTPESK